MKITIKQKHGVKFRICTGNAEYYVDESIPSVDADISEGFVTVEEVDKKEKLTVGRMILYVLYQVFMVIARVLFQAKPDWRDSIDPFVLKSKIEVQGNIQKLTIKYTPGGYNKKKEQFYTPELRCEEEEVSITTEVRPDYKSVKSVFIDWAVSFAVLALIAVVLLLMMLFLPANPIDAGVAVLVWAVIAAIVIGVGFCVLYNREKYSEIKEMLKKYE